MKRKILILLSCICLFGFLGCAVGCVDTTDKSPVAMNASMFVTVETNVSYRIVYHKDTKVMYAVSNGVNTQGTFTLLVDSDGTPMIYCDKYANY